MLLKIGFIVNPIAGLGGKKAWKGTDSFDSAWEFFEKGESHAFERVKTALSSLSSSLPLIFYICADPMGEELLSSLPFEKHLEYTPSKSITTAQDTKNACTALIQKKVDLIVFVGGDGTARDVASVISDKIPILGIPSGVKMFSGCFLYRPSDFGDIIEAMVKEDVDFAPEDIMDVDEKLFRENKVHATLFGQSIVPQKPGLIQGGKVSSSSDTSDSFFSMSLELEEVYKINEGIVLLGTGSTIFHVMKELELEKTLLGVDVLTNGKLTHKDVDENLLFEIVEGQDVKIVLTPIGGTGFIFGRGNQQISARILNSVKSLQIIIISTETKLETIDALQLDLNEQVTISDIKNGFVKVLVGFHQYKLKKIVLTTV